MRRILLFSWYNQEAARSRLLLKTAKRTRLKRVLFAAKECVNGAEIQVKERKSNVSYSVRQQRIYEASCTMGTVKVPQKLFCAGFRNVFVGHCNNSLYPQLICQDLYYGSNDSPGKRNYRCKAPQPTSSWHMVCKLRVYICSWMRIPLKLSICGTYDGIYGHHFFMGQLVRCDLALVRNHGCAGIPFLQGLLQAQGKNVWQYVCNQ